MISIMVSNQFVPLRIRLKFLSVFWAVLRVSKLNQLLDYNKAHNES